MPTPVATSTGRGRTRRSSPWVASASAPSPSPVRVIRCQKRDRGPRKTAPKAPYAAATLAAVRAGCGRSGSFTGLLVVVQRCACVLPRQREGHLRSCGGGQPDHEERTEGGVQP